MYLQFINFVLTNQSMSFASVNRDTFQETDVAGEQVRSGYMVSTQF